MRYLIVLLLAACATEPSYRWDRLGATDEQRYQETAYCEQQAFAVPNSGEQRIAIVYATCMQSRGWHLVDR